MSIQSNLESVKRRIEAAARRAGPPATRAEPREARRAGRDPAAIKLIAVSKGKTVEDIIEAVKAGQLAFGENYAQELRDKFKELVARDSSLVTRKTSDERRATNDEIEWHFIGHLQKNKIKYVLPIAKWIHTIDSIELIKAIADRTLRANEPTCLPAGMASQRVTNFLIEVNVSGEATKSGIPSQQLPSFIEAFADLEKTSERANERTCLPAGMASVRAYELKGLMCMPPFSDNPETSRPYFKELARLLDEINKRAIYPTPLTELSMGMTQDFEVAIEEGATMVRIGTAIFGAR